MDPFTFNGDRETRCSETAHKSFNDDKYEDKRGIVAMQGSLFLLLLTMYTKLSPRTGDNTAPLSPSFSPHLPALLVSIKSIFRLCSLLRLRRSISAGPTCREAIHPLFCFSCSPPHVSVTLFSVNIRRGKLSPALPTCLSSAAYLSSSSTSHFPSSVLPRSSFCV